MAVIRVGAERKELCDTFDDSGGECVSDTVMPDSDEVSTHITITDSHCKNAEEPEPTLARTRKRKAPAQPSVINERSDIAIGNEVSCKRQAKSRNKSLQTPATETVTIKNIDFSWQKKRDLPPSQSHKVQWEPTSRTYTNENPTPTELFELFFDGELVSLITEQTNKYASQKGNIGFIVDNTEIKVFIAILLLSGYIPLPQKKMFWEESSESHNECVANAMRRNRFNDILQYLHLADNDNLGTSKLAKVLPYLVNLNMKFLQFFPAEQELSVDESMIPYFGRHSSKQFIRNKPVRFGYKVWSLCTRLGYMVQFEAYEGKAALYNKDLGLGGSVVVDLLSELPSNGYKIYCDNYFTTIKLFGIMSEKGIGLTGTIRSNRLGKCPVDSKAIAKKDRGSFDYCYSPNGCLVIVSWNDNNVVTAASNCHAVHPLGKASRYSQANHDRVTVDVPHLIQQYNSFMGGVDRFDQNVACYRSNIRSKKWWFAFFVFGLEAAMQNAFQLYRARKQQYDGASAGWDLLSFRRYVVQTYLRKYGKPSRLGRPSAHMKIEKRILPDIRFDNLQHWPADSATQRRCGQCGGKARVVCTKCDVALHVSCFRDFHSR